MTQTASSQKALPGQDCHTPGSNGGRSQFAEATTASLSTELHVIAHGAIAYCRDGHADVMVNFGEWHVERDTVITLFPGDAVRWDNPSADLRLELLRYDASMLREASLQMEHTVYSLLRHDRLCGDHHIARSVAGVMMDMLRYYFTEQHCESIDRIVVLQLTTFFLGFYDYIRQQPHALVPASSQRTDEVFHRFMELMESEHRLSHEVRHYADRLCISPKYLNMIVSRKTGLTPKKVIDEYVVLQIKLALRTTTLTVRQLADEFHFTDPSFFIRYFKARTGLSPQGYRIAAARAPQ